jgi:hypothetical protein
VLVKALRSFGSRPATAEYVRGSAAKILLVAVSS